MQNLPEYSKQRSIVDQLWKISILAEEGTNLAITNIGTSDEKFHYGEYLTKNIVEGIKQIPSICDEITFANKLACEVREHKATQIELNKQQDEVLRIMKAYHAMEAEWKDKERCWKKEKAELEQKCKVLEDSEERLRKHILGDSLTESKMESLVDWSKANAQTPIFKDKAETQEYTNKGIFSGTRSEKVILKSTQVGMSENVFFETTPNFKVSSVKELWERDLNSKQDTSSELENDTGGHYRFQYCVPVTQADANCGTIKINLDPFRIADIYGVESFAAQTILKKVLCAGNRGHNSEREDVEDIMCAARRWLQMLDEDDALSAVICPSEKE